MLFQSGCWVASVKLYFSVATPQEISTQSWKERGHGNTDIQQSLMGTVKTLFTQMTRVFWTEPISRNRDAQNTGSAPFVTFNINLKTSIASPSRILSNISWSRWIILAFSKTDLLLTTQKRSLFSLIITDKSNQWFIFFKPWLGSCHYSIWVLIRN